MVDITDNAKGGGYRRVEVPTRPGRRRKWSDEDKARIVAETLKPGAVVADVARHRQVCPQPARFHPARDVVAAAAPERVAHAEAFFANTGADIRPGAPRAFYVPNLDYIRLPAIEDFFCPEAYYATLAHEMGHWTSYASRLNREAITGRHGEDAHAVEEILAELTAAFVAAA